MSHVVRRRAKVESATATATAAVAAAAADADCVHCKELGLKLEQREREHNELRAKLLDAEEKISNFQSVLEPACQEWMNLNEQLEEEQKIRLDVETTAKQVRAENIKLKRQSHALLKKLDVAPKIFDIEVENGPENDSLERKLAEVEVERDALVKKLERENATAAEKLQSLENKNKDLIKKQVDLVKQNEELQNLINNFRRTSTLAMDEFSRLQDQMNEEMLRRQEAQQFALDCSVREMVLDRRSDLLHSSAPELLVKIEELSKELELERDRHKKEVEELEEEMTSSADVKRTSTMEARLEIANSEVERLHKSVLELEAWKEEAAKEIETLRRRCEEVSLPLPPPPPPPPPPCPAPAPFMATTTIRIKKSASCKVPTAGETSPSPNRDDLMSDLKDMMNKLKQGEKRQNQTVKIRKVAEKELPPAMKELQSVLDKMKTRKGSDSQVSDMKPAGRTSCQKGRPAPAPPSKNFQLRKCVG